MITLEQYRDAKIKIDVRSLIVDELHKDLRNIFKKYGDVSFSGDCFLQILSKMGQFDAPSEGTPEDARKSFLGWANRLARNLAIDRSKKENSRPDHVEYFEEDPDTNPQTDPAQLIHEELDEEGFVSGLPEVQQKILTMRLEGYRDQEIYKSLKISRRTFYRIMTEIQSQWTTLQAV